MQIMTAHNGYISFGHPSIGLDPEGNCQKIYSVGQSVQQLAIGHITSVNIVCIEKFLNVLLELFCLE